MCVSLKVTNFASRHLSEVLEIENEAFLYPWDEATFKQALRQYNVRGIIMEQKSRVVGYLIYEITPKKLHVLNMATSCESRRQGIGLAMLGRIIDRLPVFAEVSEWNDEAIEFFRNRGFVATGVAKNYYDNGMDAYIFKL